MKSNKSITKSFNAALFLYLLLSSSLHYLFEPARNVQVPWDRVYDWSPLFAIITAIIMGLFSIAFGAVLIEIFWNRFIADVFRVKEITFDESLAIILIIAIFSA